jgi:hypothetical protein
MDRLSWLENREISNSIERQPTAELENPGRKRLHVLQ